MKRKILLVALIAVFVLSLTLAACNTDKEYNATFETNGGTAVEAVKVSVLDKPTSTRDGHMLVGWYLTSDFSDAGVTFPYKLTQDTTFYAKWEKLEEQKYLVQFIPNGGTFVSARNCSEIETEPETTREGYTFAGWFDNEQCSGTRVTFPYKVTKETNLYAKWEEIPAEKFIVEFVTNGGSPVRADLYSVIEKSPVTERNGYTFIGWFDNEELTGDKAEFPYAVTSRVTLYAKWIRNELPKFTVSFDTHGGEEIKSVLSSGLDVSPTPVRQDYVFLGWYDNAEYTGSPITFPYEVTSDVTLHAKWEKKAPDTFTVNFDTGIGSQIATRQTNVISSSPVTTVAGNYRFDGWYDNEKFQGNPIAFPYTVTKDITLYAKWSETGFTLYFNTMGGNSVASKSNVLTISSNIELPIPSREGYTFEGWYLDEQCVTAVTLPYTLTTETTFFAKWKDASEEPDIPITFTVHFVDAGSSLTITVNGQQVTTSVDNTSSDVRRGKPFITVEDKAQIVIPNPTRDGAKFLGWTATVNGTEMIELPYLVDGNKVLYAHWQMTVKPNETDSALLKTYLDKASNNADTFGVGYGMLIQNKVGTVDQTWYRNDYRPGKIVSEVYSYSETANNGDGGWLLDYLDFAFARSDNDDYWMAYTNDPAKGSYQYGGRWYTAEPISNIEEGFYMVYLNQLSKVDSSKFYKYNGKWYAVEDYADTVGKLLLGNASGDPSKYNITYTEFALTFDENGVITNIDAKGSILDSYNLGTGIATTVYYSTHTIEFLTFDPAEVSDISEDEFLQDQIRPSGLYPELDPDDANRKGADSDGKAYTTAQLQAALAELINYKGYYTLAGNTFSGFTYATSKVTTYGKYGIVKYDDYAGYTWGEQTSAAQSARDPWYFKYDENTKAFFLAIPGSNGYGIYCDKFSYKNTYEYNQYLLGTQGAISFNCRYPSVGLRLLDAQNFVFNAKGGYFEFSGSAEEIKLAGQLLFGDMDFTYPELGETETYEYLRLYMNAGKLVKVLAATNLELAETGGTEFFIKEFVITEYSSDAVMLPSGVEARMIAPGEEAANGSISGLQTAITTTRGKNHKYTDLFVFDDGDELGGVGYEGHNESGDIYIHYNGATRLGDNGMVLYFKNGVLYEVGVNGEPVRITMDHRYVSNDIHRANSLVLWAYSMADLLDAKWFYQGKDGNYYGKPEYMDKLSWALGRYSGSKQYLEGYTGMTFSKGYNAFLVLDFVCVTVDSNGLSGVYYSGAIRVEGMSGTHDKPFSGRATFTYSPPSISVNDTVDEMRPTIYQYLDAEYSFEVDYEGFLNLTEVPNATGYKAYVYNLTDDTLIAEFDVTNGFDLKTVAALNAGTDVKNYRIAIRALGGGAPIDGVSYRDGAQSALLTFELSTVPKQPKPTVTLDKQNATVTVSGDYDAEDYYRYVIKLGNDQIANGGGNKKISDKLDLTLFGLEAYKTYTVEIYVMGTQGEVRDSETVTLSYTPPKADGKTYLGDLFAAIDYTKSFSVSFNAQDRYRYHYFDGLYNGIDLMDASTTWLSGNCLYGLNFSMYFEASINQGKITFYMYDPNKSGAHLYDVVFRFTKQGDKLVGQLTKTVDGSQTESKQLTTDLLFVGVSALENGFDELKGQINKWSGLTYRYNGDLADPSVQSAIAGFSVLEEMLGVDLTYTAMQLNMCYKSDGTLETNCCSMALAANTDDGHSLIVSFLFTDFGKDLTNRVKD